MTTLQRKDLVRIVAKRTRTPQAVVGPVVNELFGKLGHGGSLADVGLIAEAVAKGYEVDIVGFGKFDRRERKGRTYQKNVHLPGVDGEKTSMPARHIPYFTPHRIFKAFVRRTGAAEKEKATK